MNERQNHFISFYMTSEQLHFIGSQQPANGGSRHPGQKVRRVTLHNHGNYCNFLLVLKTATKFNYFICCTQIKKNTSTQHTQTYRLSDNSTTAVHVAQLQFQSVLGVASA